MDRGWVKLYRKVEDWEWYREPATAHLFFHLLISANRQDRKWNGIDVPAGCLITSIRHLADQTGLTIQQVRTSLKRLNSTHDITQTSNKKYTLIKVNNYQVYQGSNTEANTLVTQSQHSDNTLVTTNKKSIKKEVKKERKTTRDGGCLVSFESVKNKYSDQVAEEFLSFCNHWEKKPTASEKADWMNALDLCGSNAERIAAIRYSSGGNPRGLWYRGIYPDSVNKSTPTEPNLPAWYGETPTEFGTKEEVEAIMALQKQILGDSNSDPSVPKTLEELDRLEISDEIEPIELLGGRRWTFKSN